MINNKEETNDGVGEGQKNPEDFLQDSIIVHTMHKGFKKNAITRGNSKKVGIIVMVSGFFLLLAVGALSYYLVVKKDIFSLSGGKTIIVQEEKPLVVEKEKPKTEPIVATTTEATTTKEVIIASSSIASVVSTSSDLLLPATSSDPVSEGSSTVVTENSPAVSEIIVKEAIDTDNDGLSDLEEEIFGTDKKLIDTDSDKYSDFLEVDNMHNPNGVGAITNNIAIIEYLNVTYKYSLLYPSFWSISNYDNDDSIIFKIDGLQFVQVMAQKNTNNQTLEEWYKGQFSVDLIDDAQRITKNGWSVIKSKDGLNWFLMEKDSADIFIITYNIGITKVFNYKTIFQMMINSFKVVK